MIRLETGDLKNDFNVYSGKQKIGKITLHMQGKRNTYAAHFALTNETRTFNTMREANLFIKERLSVWVKGAGLRKS